MKGCSYALPCIAPQVHRAHDTMLDKDSNLRYFSNLALFACIQEKTCFSHRYANKNSLQYNVNSITGMLKIMKKNTKIMGYG